MAQAKAQAKVQEAQKAVMPATQAAQKAQVALTMTPQIPPKEINLEKYIK